jgi:hypothetical protein
MICRTRIAGQLPDHHEVRLLAPNVVLEESEVIVIGQIQPHRVD